MLLATNKSELHLSFTTEKPNESIAAVAIKIDVV